MIGHRFGSPPVIVSYLLGLLFAGCAQTTLTSTFPATKGLPRPDRVLVYDFAVTPEQEFERRSGSPVQTEEDVRVGKALARALSERLVLELRSRGIEADRAGETARPGDTTASIRGAFLHTDRSDSTTHVPVGFTLRGGQVRTRVNLFQGAGLKLQIVGEGETVTPSGLKPGAVRDAVITADAQRTAEVLAERIAQYYRRGGWIN
jgi:hypothetical protein